MTYNICYQVQNKIRIVNDLFICPYCQESFRALAYHTNQVHNVSGRQLRHRYGLPYNYSLQTPELKELRRNQALKNKMDIQLIKTGVNTRFKRGRILTKKQINDIKKGHIKKNRMID